MRNRFITLWIWLALCPLAVDFKSVDENGSRITQILLTLPAIAGTIVLVMTAPRFAGGSQLRSAVTIALMLTVPGSLVPQLLQGNDFGNYLRVLLPFMLMLFGYLAACRPWQTDRLVQVEKAMFTGMVISLLFSFGYGMAIGGGLETVRFRIVSVVFLALQGLLLHEFVIARRFSKLTLLLFLLSVAIELLSVTRSLLVGTAMLFCLATWLGAPSLRQLLKSVARAMVITVALIGGTVVIGSALFPSVAAHWEQRISAAKATASGIDPTTATRLAEIKDQMDQVTASTVSLLLGKGFGHNYRYSPDYLTALSGQMSEKEFYAINEWAAGHNFWVYQLFAGGVVFGLALPFAVLFALWRGAVIYRRWRRHAPDAPYLPVLGRALMVLAALPATSIGGNPLGPRYSGLVYGVALGLLVGSCMRLQRLGVRRGTPAAARAPATQPATPQPPRPPRLPVSLPVLPPARAAAPSAPRLTLQGPRP
ncbi:hypothetical protein CTP10_R29990 [Cupriavidus sp. P-10]|uniref:hypothetical protein n=1 Tax=Cupriavidus sp. P-10 TaxID=2027911 RepID=UPI000E2FDAAD|nr:hypothetical protein [Cupriavidus sp. P-10]BDB25617.1 hypothetical protein CTP10_R29990 [Cupriavidus sp. P-10]